MQCAFHYCSCSSRSVNHLATWLDHVERNSNGDQDRTPSEARMLAGAQHRIDFPARHPTSDVAYLTAVRGYAGRCRRLRPACCPSGPRRRLPRPLAARLVVRRSKAAPTRALSSVHERLPRRATQPPRLLLPRDARTLTTRVHRRHVRTRGARHAWPPAVRPWRTAAPPARRPIAVCLHDGNARARALAGTARSTGDRGLRARAAVVFSTSSSIVPRLALASRVAVHTSPRPLPPPRILGNRPHTRVWRWRWTDDDDAVAVSDDF